MATTYHLSRGAPPARHKRKGIPMRSPCQRDMAEAPGVVFRFPDKIASISSGPDLSTTGVSAVVSGLNILPSSAGLPSGLGAKTAASVIAAAATAIAPPTSLSMPLAEESAPDEGSGGSQANSASSTPLLRPVTSAAITAVPIHRSASNVLHYPELLSDLRDRLIQIHQVSHHLNHHTSSGVESDSNHTAQQQSIKRARVKRLAGATTQRPGIYTSPGARRSGLRGGGATVAGATTAAASIALLAAGGPGGLAVSHGSTAVGRSRSELNSTEHGLAENLTASAAKAAEAVGFHRRHSIGAVQAQVGMDDDEILDIVDSESTASSSGRHANQPHGQVGRQLQVGGMATISRAAVPRQAPSAPMPKRKKDKDAGDRRSGSPLAHPYHPYHHHQRFHPQPHPKRASGALPLPPGSEHHHHATFGGSKRSCASCGASSTPCWRPGLIDSMTLCNLCGLRYKKGKVYCAACSYVPTKTEIATGGASICRRCSSSIHMPSVMAIAGSPSSSPMPGGVPAPHTHRHNAGF
ncbi:DNA-binding transcription repressor [Coemansia pectinata]|uniref:DNA-binding transcription repressor n=1 Tax=Coemansia pectinata TaxID=1052879 RepID=A0A9W8GWD0_9FUNG|nr:DNA-binding transcription repressor [Coemansia pectinata]